MATKIKVRQQHFEEVYCKQCKGSCWDETSNATTQLAAKKLFGIIPNNCVPDNSGHVRCPYSRKN